MIQPFLTHRCQEDKTLERELKQIIHNMRETTKYPDLKRTCENDTLIKEFGLTLLLKIGPKEEQRRKHENNISTKLRAVARLVKELNKEKVFPLPLSDFLTPSAFKTVVNTVNEMSRAAGSPNLALTLGHYLKQMAFLKRSIALDENNASKRSEAKYFLEKYAALWNAQVASGACRTMKLRKMNKPDDIPLTEDLEKLKEHVVGGISNAMQIVRPSLHEYADFAMLIITRIAIFNKRRIAEVDELTVHDFNSRIKGADAEGNAAITNTLTQAEKSMCSRYIIALLWDFPQQDIASSIDLDQLLLRTCGI